MFCVSRFLLFMKLIFYNFTRYAYPTLVILIIKDLLYLIVFVITFMIYKQQLNQTQILHRTLSDAKQRLIRKQEDRSVLRILLIMPAVFTALVFPRDILHVIYIVSWLAGPSYGIKKSMSLVHINSILTVAQLSNSVVNVFIYAHVHTRFVCNKFIILFFFFSSKKVCTLYSVTSSSSSSISKSKQ